MRIIDAPVPPGYRTARWEYTDRRQWWLIATNAHGDDAFGPWDRSEDAAGWLRDRAAGLPCDCCGYDGDIRDGWTVIDGAPYCAHCATDEGCGVMRFTSRVRH